MIMYFLVLVQVQIKIIGGMHFYIFADSKGSWESLESWEKLERCILAPPIEVEKTWLTGIIFILSNLFYSFYSFQCLAKGVHGCFKVLGSVFFHPTIN